MASPEHELLIATRRDLHRNPEIGFEEHRTAGIIADRLRAAGYEVRTGVAVTGVIGTLRGGAGPGPTLIMRADMDALPIHEETTHDFASTVEGRMHACGHDGHVAIGLAVAERLARRKDEIRGEIRYVFQPAEEGLGGANRMVAEGVLEGVDAAMGLHLWLGLESGIVGVVEGPQMAGSHDFSIRVTGRGGHGALPHETIDAVYVASQVVVALQSIVSRNVSPLEAAVVSVGAFHAGNASNVIAETAELEGTIRAFQPEVLDQVRKRVGEVADGVARTLGAEAEVRFRDLAYLPTTNAPGMAKLVRKVAMEIVGEERLRSDPEVRTMAAEDFSEITARIPSVYFFVGARNEAIGAIHPHHSPHFDICEEALPVAVDVLESAALAYLSGRTA